MSEGATGIVVTGRETARGEAVADSLRARGADAIFVAAELAEMGDVEGLIEATDAHFGRLDVLVNAAAITWRGSITDTTQELWDLIMGVNLRAPFFLIQGAVAIMRREGIEGSVINIGSVTAHGGAPVLAPYSISKGALNVLTKNVGYALSRDRIRVNALNLGWMDTPGEDEIQRRFHDAQDGWLEAAEATMPFGRLLKPDEVAKAVTFLASSDSGMMTGAIIDFDQSVVGAWPEAILSPSEVPE